MMVAVVVPVMVMAATAILDDAGGQGLRDTDEKQQGQNLRNVLAHFYPPSPGVLDDDLN